VRYLHLAAGMVQSEIQRARSKHRADMVAACGVRLVEVAVVARNERAAVGTKATGVRLAERAAACWARHADAAVEVRRDELAAAVGTQS
jgi:hypothetical protein